MPTFSGRCAAPAPTSASPPRWSTGSIRWGRRSRAGSWPILSTRPGTCCGSTGTLPCHSPTSSQSSGLIHAPDGAKVVALVLCHSGPLDAGATATRPIKSFGAPLMDTIGPMSYCDLNTMLDAAYPKGALSYWKSNFLARLSDDAIDTMIDRFARCPSPMDQVLLEHLHGAATRVGVADTAFPHRAVGYNFLVASQWTDPARTDQSIAWVRETYAAMTPF